MVMNNAASKKAFCQAHENLYMAFSLGPRWSGKSSIMYILYICTRAKSNEMNQIDNHDCLQVSFGLKCSQVQRQTERVASIT